MDESRYNELLVELQCPVCLVNMSAPIRQCATGHSICNDCRKRLTKCPLCLKNFSEATNIALGALAAKIFYPCGNKDAGCKANLPFSERANHESSCLYKGFRCPVEECSWFGRYDEIETHWTAKNVASKPLGEYNKCELQLKDSFNYVNLIKAYGKLFWLKCKIIDDNIFWAVQYIGNENDADNYSYQIELAKFGFPNCAALLRGYCHKIGTANSEIFEEESCISMSIRAIKQYVGEDGVLTYNMRVFEGKAEEEAQNASVKLRSLYVILKKRFAE